MKKEFIRCEFCKIAIPAGTCKLAAYSTTIDGKQYIFCCKQHAQRYKEKKEKAK